MVPLACCWYNPVIETLILSLEVSVKSVWEATGSVGPVG